MRARAVAVAVAALCCLAAAALAVGPMSPRLKSAHVLVDWARDSGGDWLVHPALEPQESATRGIGLVARAPIEAGETLLRVPIGRMITTAAIALSDVAPALVDARVLQSDVLAVYLLHLKDASMFPLIAPPELWRLYLATLPPASELDVPLAWSPSELDCVNASAWGRFARAQRTLAEAEYVRVFTGALFAASPVLFCDESPAFARNAFVWARAVVMSRGFHVRDASARIDTRALVPLFDLANTASGASAVNTVEVLADGRLALVATAAIGVGDELTVFYSSRNLSGPELLFHYGMVDPTRGGWGAVAVPLDALATDTSAEPAKRAVQLARARLLESLGVSLSQPALLALLDPAGAGLSRGALALFDVLLAEPDELARLDGAHTRADPADRATWPRPTAAARRALVAEIEREIAVRRDAPQCADAGNSAPALAARRAGAATVRRVDMAAQILALELDELERALELATAVLVA